MTPTREEFYNALIERHGADNQKKFDSATVAICGLGGLGSNIAICLARAGVGKLILIDFDKVDVSNLHRQQYKADQVGRPKPDALSDNLNEINPYITIETHNTKVTEENVIELTKEADIVCEAFDKAENKAMLVNAILENAPEKYLVSSSGMAGFGSANLIKTKKISKRFFLSGDSVSDVNDGIGLISSRVMVCAAHEAHMALRIIMGEATV
ncbi:thiamine biosynthesis protein ThiF [Butyrivibrio sp. LB2008]|uniref:thiamine biosynthesis protein ThiF n=1 Tax=Butyrivibrio sp. LB2008 TaxID=1408305 RepID=UPI00047B2E22|nr:thiamine biosynthesis protein ThiF [Butyrivibrio sp. LB2008]